MFPSEYDRNKIYWPGDAVMTTGSIYRLKEIDTECNKIHSSLGKHPYLRNGEWKRIGIVN